MKKFYICVILIFSFFITTQVSALSSSYYTMQGYAYNPNLLSGVTTTDFTAEYLSFKGFQNISIDYTKTSRFRFNLSDLSSNLSNSNDTYLAFLLYDTYDGVPVVWNGNVACNVNPSLNSSVQVNVVDNSSVIIPYNEFGNVYSVTCDNATVGSDGNISLNIEHGVRSGYSSSSAYRISIGILASIRYTKSEFEFLSDIYSSINNSNVTQQQIIQEQQKTTEEVKKNTQATKEVNNTLKDSSVDNQQAEGFFNDFDDNSHGLSGIITAPLNMINNLASATCSPITINIPFVDTEFNLPCMSTIYQQNFGNLFSIYRTITFGIVAYYVCVNIFALVKGFKDPENDKVEVVEL